MFTWRNATLVFLTVLVLETSILIHVYFNAVFLSTKDVINAVSRETLLLFNSYDTNGDGAIDLWEFEAIKQWISETNLQTEHEDIWMSDNDIDINFENLKTTTGEILDIKADFTPLVLNSMTKFKDEQAFQEDLKTLTGLRIWQIALKKQAAFAVEAFNIFLPKRKNMDVGEAWTFVAPNVSQYEPALSSNRYIPLAVNTDHVTLHYLLQMFHPRPFLYSRFPPQGAVACIRAENEKFLEIEFRLHAEFQLNKPPLLPLWFTPAQFSGRLIITKDGNHIEHFEMEVPNNQTLNVDMEWLTGRTKSDEVVIDDESVQKNNDQNNMEVDIGYLPKMKLTGIAPSYHQKDNASLTSVVQEIQWEREIPHEEARMILEQKMYPFKKVPYLSFDQAYTKAKEEKKLVHSILLWGALDDQSCSGRTLRETALESSPVMKLLTSHFVSTWSLLDDLKRLSKNKYITPELQKQAKLAVESYRFPVESMVALANGTVLHRMNANELLDNQGADNTDVEAGLSDGISANYYKFLNEAISRAKAHIDV